LRHFSVIFGNCVFGGVLLPRAAAADIAPPGACQIGEIGQACDEAVDEAGTVVGSGVCVAEKCTRASPSGSMAYDCAICRASQPAPEAGGAGAGGGSPGAGAPSKPTDKPAPKSDEGGGCSLTTTRGGSGFLGVASLLGLGVALARRRR